MADASRVSSSKSWKKRGKAPSLLDDMAVTRERVAEQLLALRQLHGTPDKPLTQEKAAQRVGVGVREWQRWENQEVTAQTANLSKIAESFDVPLDIFDDGKPDRTGTPLAERIDELHAKLDEILDRLGNDNSSALDTSRENDKVPKS